MTHIAVFSDSHASEVMLKRACKIIEASDFDHVFHLGDFRSDALWLAERIHKDVTGVPGNCDFYSRDARELEKEIEGVRLLLTHGDHYQVKSRLDRLSYRAEERNCSLALFGHTHIAFAGYVGSLLLVNPGAVRDGHYAVIEMDAGKVVPRLLRL